MEIFKIENLSFKYGSSENYALKNINISINSGDFIIIFGKSGSGKTTFLKMLNKVIMPYGSLDGNIFYNNKPLLNYDEIDIIKNIAYISQNTDTQIVTDRVYKEISFNLENLGEKQNLINLRVGETVTYFGLNNIFYNETETLSGGEKKLVSLAGVLTMNPKVLLLDEPFSQLDPVSISRLVFSLQKLNKELGITIIITQHNLDDIFDIADKIIVFENGEIVDYDTPQNIANYSKEKEYYHGVPQVVRLFHEKNIKDKTCPLNIAQAVKVFDKTNIDLNIKTQFKTNNKVISIKNLFVSYDKQSKDVINNMSYDFYEKNIYTIIGGNGCGKSTLLKAISNLIKPYSGTIKIYNKKLNKYSKDIYYKLLALLPQNCDTMFSNETVIEEYKEIISLHKEDELYLNEIVKNYTRFFNIEDLLYRNPADLSGGELQLVAFCKILLQQPKILLLDEITKGLDYDAKIKMIKFIENLKKSGVTIICVTHDLEFAYKISDKCIFSFNGDFIYDDEPSSFFNKNIFYTMPVCKLKSKVGENN